MQLSVKKFKMGNVILSRKSVKPCIICYELSNEHKIINCMNSNNNNLTCPNNDYNYICIDCSQEWLIKNGRSCPICRNNNIIINEIKDESDIEEDIDIVDKKCFLNYSNCVHPAVIIINKHESCKIKYEKLYKLLGFILFLILFELTGIIVSCLYIFIFICNFNLNKFKDEVIYDLLLHEEYYVMCPIFTLGFIFCILWCRSCVNWCKNYDSLYH